MSFLSLNNTIRSFNLLVVSLALGLSSTAAFAADAKKTNEKTKNKDEQSADQQAKGASKMTSGKNPIVIMETSMGTLEIELYADKAPISVENFLKYTDDGFFNGTIFHRVIPTFMIQGGGFTTEMTQKPTRDQIKNEATNGLKNTIGTLAMARTNVVDSATSQFFINVKDNDFLNYSGPNNYGYAVFGKVINGMDVVDKIRQVPTTTKPPHADVPVSPVIIKSVKRK